MPNNRNRLVVRVVVSLGGVAIALGPLVADEPKNSQTAQPAVQNDDAIKELRNLGASVEVGNPLTGNADGIRVTLGAEWHGKPADLKFLKRLPNLESFNVHGAEITDDDLKHLDGLGRLVEVQLYGSKVTADGAAQLIKTYPSINIDRRGNALLGVAGQTDRAGCRITLVQTGSAAARAGLKADDIIIKFQDHEIADFTSLIKQVSASQPGDKVAIELLRRGTEVLKKEVTLGSWK